MIRSTARADRSGPLGRAAARRRRRRRRAGSRGSDCRGTTGVGQLVAGADGGHPPAGRRGRRRRPRARRGSRPAGESAAYEMEPKATGPVPGRRDLVAHHGAVDDVAPPRLGLARTGRARAAVNSSARPQPTRPSPRRTQLRQLGRVDRGRAAARAGVPGSCERHGAGDQRATAGRRLAGWGVGRLVMSGQSLRRAPCRRGRGEARPPGAADGRMAAMTRASLDKDPRDVAAMFDDVAGKYDLTNDVLSLGQDRLWRRAVAQGGRRAARARRVLDIAAGTGTSSEPFADDGRRRRAGRLLARHAAGRQPAPPRPAASRRPTRCGCRSRTTASTR